MFSIMSNAWLFWMNSLKLSLKVLYSAHSHMDSWFLFLSDCYITAPTITTAASRFPAWAPESWGKAELIKSWHILTGKPSREFPLCKACDTMGGSICCSFAFGFEIWVFILCHSVEAYFFFLNWKTNSWLFLLHSFPCVPWKYDWFKMQRCSCNYLKFVIHYLVTGIS